MGENTEMMLSALAFGALNFFIFLAVSYYSYRAVDNLEKHPDVTSAMMFLRNQASKVFRNTALLVTVVAVGEVLIFLSHFQGQVFRTAGYSVLTVASLTVFYFARMMTEVTEPPSGKEE